MSEALKPVNVTEKQAILYLSATGWVCRPRLAPSPPDNMEIPESWIHPVHGKRTRGGAVMTQYREDVVRTMFLCKHTPEADLVGLFGLAVAAYIKVYTEAIQSAAEKALAVLSEEDREKVRRAHLELGLDMLTPEPPKEEC